jgi:hypothetical protein
VSVQQTLNERQSTHGDFADHARATQMLKTVIQNQPGWKNLNAMQRESLDMIAHKIGRILAGNPNHADHWHDIQGYAKLIEDRL